MRNARILIKTPFVGFYYIIIYIDYRYYYHLLFSYAVEMVDEKKMSNVNNC